MPHDHSESQVASKRPAPLTLPRPGFLGANAIVSGIERLVGIRACRELYHAARRRNPTDPKAFADAVLDEHGVELQVAGREHLDAANDSGRPVLVVANHPFGGIEGVAMVSLLVGLRPDAKVFANSYLGGLDGLSEAFLLVDILGEGKVASHRAANGTPMREAIRCLKNGGMLGMFPAGEVAHLTWSDRKVVEGTWHAHLVSLVRRTGATVVPLFFQGQNPWPFQIAGLVHPKLRTLLLARQMAASRNKPLAARVGRPILASALESMDPTEAVDHLRSSTLCLRYADQGPRPTPAAPRAQPFEPVRCVDANAHARFEGTLDRLPAEALLATSGDWQVYAASSSMLGESMQTLGALREATFREVGEGSGKAVDLDTYDSRYHHLILWHRGQGELAGAYRIGPDRDQPGRSPDLYTLREFRLPQALLSDAPICDLGRSFIRPAFQKEASALLLLWRGIAAFLDRRNLGDSRLIGPVSISGDYPPAARAAMAAWLLDPKRRGRFERMANRVKPCVGMNKFDPADHLDAGTLRLAHRLTDVRQLDGLVRDLTGGTGIPVLLRQYLRLGAVPLAVAEDPSFNDCLDVCCLFDRADADPRRVARITASRPKLVAA